MMGRMPHEMVVTCGKEEGEGHSCQNATSFLSASRWTDPVRNSYCSTIRPSAATPRRDLLLLATPTGNAKLHLITRPHSSVPSGALMQIGRRATNRPSPYQVPRISSIQSLLGILVFVAAICLQQGPGPCSAVMSLVVPATARASSDLGESDETALKMVLVPGRVASEPTQRQRRYLFNPENQVRLLKKSPGPQWEDLGWAWGKKKRSDPSASDGHLHEWEDLGWAWGKRSDSPSAKPSRRGGGEWDELGWAWGKRSSPDATDSIKDVVEAINNVPPQSESQLPPIPNAHLRAVQTLVKKNPDWNDLGWAWGRRR